MKAERDPGKRTRYLCKCDCGVHVTVDYGNLQTGNTQSCGCLFLETLHRRKQPDQTIAVSTAWRFYRRNALLRGYAWTLTKGEFQALVVGRCHYCDFVVESGVLGIDRVMNSEGYTPSNCVTCCRWCNWGKNERSVEEFYDWVRRLNAKLLVHI